MNKILVTGAAGFIGFHLCKKLLAENHQVIGIDNINDYYSTDLKKDRLNILKQNENFIFKLMDIADFTLVDELFSSYHFETVYHLAAQAGVRYSLENPHTYIRSNMNGFFSVLECCKNHQISHLIYASSSSVYGLNKKQPYSTHDDTNHPVSLYAATKKANELLAHSYSHLFDIPTTGLRFFTVYGPWGRPDMAYFKFVQNILNNQEIEVYNYGDMYRDFTYIDDIVEAVSRLKNYIPTPNSHWSSQHPDPSSSSAPYQIFNIGNNSPVNLMDFIRILQEELNIEAKIKFLSMQPGDVYKTWADSSELYKAIQFNPSTNINEGIHKFVAWYKQHYLLKSPGVIV